MNKSVLCFLTGIIAIIIAFIFIGNLDVGVIDDNPLSSIPRLVWVIWLWALIVFMFLFRAQKYEMALFIILALSMSISTLPNIKYLLPWYFGGDVFSHIGVIKDVMQSGELNFRYDYVYYTMWPIFDIFNSMNALVLGLNSMYILKIIPFVVSSLNIMLIYILANRLFYDKRLSVMSAAVFASSDFFTYYATQTVMQPFSYAFLLLCLYLSFRENGISNKILLIVTIITMVSSHFITPIYLIILLICLRMLQLFFKYRTKHNIAINISLVLFFSYLLYIATTKFESILIGLKKSLLFGIAEYTAIISARPILEILIINAQKMIWLPFVIIGLIHIKRNLKFKYRLEYFYLLLILILFGISGLVIALAFGRSLISPERLYMVFYIPVSVFVALGILKFLDDRKLATYGLLFAFFTSSLFLAINANYLYLTSFKNHGVNYAMDNREFYPGSWLVKFRISDNIVSDVTILDTFLPLVGLSKGEQIIGDPYCPDGYYIFYDILNGKKMAGEMYIITSERMINHYIATSPGTRIKLTDSMIKALKNGFDKSRIYTSGYSSIYFN